jgi:ABC-type antimicrobial peptide transport system permease subunit
LHSAISPLAICNELGEAHTISVALDPAIGGTSSFKKIINKMSGAWSKVYPDETFNYQFQDETIAGYYQAEQRTLKLLSWATALMIFISCLGLFGLVIYVTNQRTKEVGIRKILGATVAQIIVLLSSDFLKLVGWAFLIAVPLAWWGGSAWLNNFAYRTHLSWWIFLVGGAVMAGAALIILLLRTFKTANSNPVESLRTE